MFLDEYLGDAYSGDAYSLKLPDKTFDDEGFACVWDRIKLTRKRWLPTAGSITGLNPKSKFKILINPIRPPQISGSSNNG